MAFIRMQVQVLSDQDTDAQHFMRFSTEISKQVTAARASACACCSRGFKAHSDAVTAPDSWPQHNEHNEQWKVLSSVRPFVLSLCLAIFGFPDSPLKFFCTSWGRFTSKWLVISVAFRAQASCDAAKNWMKNGWVRIGPNPESIKH